MNRIHEINEIRRKLKSDIPVIGSWIQMPCSTSAEIIGNSGYDWVAIDLEHGSVGHHQLPDLFRSLELGGTLPLVRLATGDPYDCKKALDSGAAGVIVPMIETAEQLKAVRDSCRWPPSGTRGVAFTRANLFGARFEEYIEEAQKPLLVAMIESKSAIHNIDSILSVSGLDAIMIGPYDLSASLGLTGDFDNQEFIGAINSIIESCVRHDIPCGIHVVMPNVQILEDRIKQGYRFIAYSIDSVFLVEAASRPKIY